MTGNQLSTLPNREALQQLAAQVKEVETVEDAVTAAKYTAALSAAAKATKTTQDVQTEVSIIRIQAERKLGELLNETIQQGRWNDITLADYGITKIQSARAKKIASIPQSMLDEWFNDSKLGGKDVSLASVVKLVPRVLNQKPKSNIQNLYTSPPVDVQLGRELAERVGEDIADIINDAISKCLQTMPNQKQAYVWMRYHGINEQGEQTEPWTFPTIAATLGGTTREYIENQYYRASSLIMERVVARLVLELKQAHQAMN